jgi:hypothetical protein
MRTITEQNYDMIVKALLEEDKKLRENSQTQQIKQTQQIDVRFDSIRHIAYEIQKTIDELEREINELEKVNNQTLDKSTNKTTQIIQEVKEVDKVQAKEKAVDTSYSVRYMIHSTAFKEKPVGEENNTIHKMNIVNSTVKELAKELVSGKTVKPGILLGGTSNNNWVGQQLFFVDVDEANITIKDSLNTAKSLGLKPAIVYKSFSYTDKHQKHRLVFVANKQIKDKGIAQSIINFLIDAFKADIRTKNLSRVYYGTNKTDCYLDETAVIDVEYLKAISLLQDDSKIKEIPVFIEAKRSDLSNSQEDVLDVFESFFENSSHKYKNKEFTNFTKLKSFIKSIPLEAVFGGTKLNCLFHKDNNPSVSIYTNEDGYSYYKCHSCGEHLDILDLIAIAYDIDTTETRWMVLAAKVIMRELKLSLVNNDWYIEELDKIKCNRLFLLNKVNKIATKYPLCYKVLITNENLLRLMLDIAESHLDIVELSDINYNHSLIFKMSSTYAASKIDKHQSTVLRRLDDLMLMGFVTKISDEEVKKLSPASYMADIKLAAKRGDKYFKTIQAYTMSRWNDKLLKYAEDMLKYAKEKGATKVGASQTQYKALGCDTRAKNTLGNTGKGKEQSERDKVKITATQAHRKLLLDWARKTVNRNGYFLKEKYLKYAKDNKIGEAHASKFMTEITTTLSLTRVTSTKETQKKYNLPTNSVRKVAFVK